MFGQLSLVYPRPGAMRYLTENVTVVLVADVPSTFTSALADQVPRVTYGLQVAWPCESVLAFPVEVAPPSWVRVKMTLAPLTACPPRLTVAVSGTRLARLRFGTERLTSSGASATCTVALAEAPGKPARVAAKPTDQLPAGELQGGVVVSCTIVRWPGTSVIEL